MATATGFERASLFGGRSDTAACAMGLGEESMKEKTESTSTRSASVQIDEKIAVLGDWRGPILDRMRKLIHEAAPDVVEEWKWMGTPVWALGGIICTGETYKAKVKLTFAKGAALADPTKLFNASLDGNTRRAIDMGEGESVDAGAFKALVHAAIALNASTAQATPKPKLVHKVAGLPHR